MHLKLETLKALNINAATYSKVLFENAESRLEQINDEIIDKFRTIMKTEKYSPTGGEKSKSQEKEEEKSNNSLDEEDQHSSSSRISNNFREDEI